MLAKFWKKGNIIVAVLSGELDHHSAAYCRDKIDAGLVKLGIKNLVIDFSGVTFMDSSGIGVIAGRFRIVKSMGGRMAIINLNRECLRLFKMSGLDAYIPVCENIDEAVKLFEKELLA